MQNRRRFSLVEREKIVEKAISCLWSKNGAIGLDYLINKRHLSENIIRDFKLGYIPEHADHQLRGRIILPLFDSSNNLISITSRAVNKETSFLPVYWHESYEKTFYLYGIQLARESMEKHGFVLVTEGQFDVLQMHNHGITNVVGLSGTKMSEVQISVVHRFCDEIILLLDSDANMSGQKGAAKIEAAAQFDVSLKLDLSSIMNVPNEYSASISRQLFSIALPENSDPDEYLIKYGADKLKKIIKEQRSEYHSKRKS